MEVSDGWVVRPRFLSRDLLRPLLLLLPSQVFPRGLPEEFTLVFTLALKKAALRDTVYLLQISDQQGYPQVLLGASLPLPSLRCFPLF